MRLQELFEENSMWPDDLKSINLCGRMNLTELWMLKERMDAGHVKMLKDPGQTFARTGKFLTIFGDEAGTYCITTDGMHGGSPADNTGWCTIIRINKLTEEHATRIMANGWPYD